MNEREKWEEFCINQVGIMGWHLDKAERALNEYRDVLRRHPYYEINPEVESPKLDRIRAAMVEIEQREKKVCKANR